MCENMRAFFSGRENSENIFHCDKRENRCFPLKDMVG
ncbi:hypothetical protein C805_01166 [Eubacterium sp. 14-2]|nr:hypothetical protein C805_01166 [Eubacterium sp. 14-2]